MAVAGCLIRLQVQAITFIMGNAIFLRIETKSIDANNVDVLQTLSETTMAPSKILDKTRPNAWWDYMIGHNVVGEWKFGILFLVVEATNNLSTISSWMLPELSSCVNG